MEKTIATGERSVHLWDVDTATLKNTLAGHFGHVFDISFFPDGKTIATGGRSVSGNGEVDLWDVDTATLKYTLARYFGHVFSISLSPDGKTIAIGSRSVSAGGEVHLWDVDTATLKYTLAEHQGPFPIVLFSPDGKTIATGGRSVSGNGEVDLWDVDTATLKNTLVGHQGPVSALSFSPDGKTIATGERSVHLWDVDTATLKNTLAEHLGPINSVSFSPDGKMVASGGSDGTIFLWDLSPTADASLSFSPSPVQSPAIGQITEPQRFLAPQGAAATHIQTSSKSGHLSLGGITLGLNSRLGTDVPFIGALGYYRPYSAGYNLGLLGTFEYGDGSWSGSLLGSDKTAIDVELFFASVMIGLDIQTESGVLILGGGAAFAEIDLGLTVDVGGYSLSERDQLNGFSPTALIAYIFHTSETALAFYARYQGESIMFGGMFGGISF